MKNKISRRLDSIKAAHESEKTISSRVGKKGKIKILKRSTEGKRFSRFVDTSDNLEIFLKTH